MKFQRRISWCTYKFLHKIWKNLNLTKSNPRMDALARTTIAKASLISQSEISSFFNFDLSKRISIPLPGEVGQSTGSWAESWNPRIFALGSRPNLWNCKRHVDVVHLYYNKLHFKLSRFSQNNHLLLSTRVEIYALYKYLKRQARIHSFFNQFRNFS